MRRSAAAPRRLAFLDACLTALDGQLRARGSRLLVVDGEPADVLPQLATRLGARLVTATVDHEPAARARAAQAARALEHAGVDLVQHDAGAIQPPGTVTTGAGEPYRVFGAFARAWETRRLRDPAPTPERLVDAAALDVVPNSTLRTRPAIDGLPSAGEDAARTRLRDFVRDGLADYPIRRDLPGVDGTSRLSPHLRFGTLSAVEALRAARDAAACDRQRRAGAAAWARELAWRDFFAHILAAFPQVAVEPMRGPVPRWRHDDRGLRAWQEGITGIPLVDAGMRELAATGWMHNRARLVTASFLTRHLLIDWRLGERHFMAHLLDGQLSQNDGNWQWVAGTGSDAQPFHRVFSPVRQGERFDPDGEYVRRWVPELARVPAKSIHQPWTLSREERRALCPDYPPAIVDLTEARARALAAYAAAQERSRAKEIRRRLPR
jgi:deoxyribodipyrimidine photo-lyase